MISRTGAAAILSVILTLLPAAWGRARAQLGALGNLGNAGGYSVPSLSLPSFGTNAFAGPGVAGVSLGSGYSIRNGGIGTGYYSSGLLYQQGYQAARPQTTTNFQPLISAITSLPGWNGPTHHSRRRLRSRPGLPLSPPFDSDGKILWPSTIPDDPASASMRRTAEAAVRAVVHESRSTGHASIRPVIDAKTKLSAMEHRVLPIVKTKNRTDGDALESFFFHLDRSLDALGDVY
jgi:hypothetical protein